MPKRIGSLTDEQKSRFGEWRDRWINIGLSTERSDRTKFESAVRDCYNHAGLAAPKRIVWVSSPLVMAFAGPITSSILGRDAVNDAVGDAVNDAVNDAVGDAVNDAVGDAVNSAVDGAVRDAVNDAVNDAVGDAVHDVVNGAVKKLWHRYIGGQFWVGGWWGSPAFVSFFTQVCDLELSDDIAARAKAFEDTCSSSCWWWPHREFVIAVERPTKICRDDRGRLHSETGNAIEWPDGWGVAAWHGTTVPRGWIDKRAELDPVIALTDPSVERRRAAAEIIGWKRVLEKLPNKTIDRDPDPEIGTLLSVDLPDAPDSRFLQVRCGTGRDFVLPVPTEVKTALEANAWTYDIKPIDLKKLEVRT